MQYDVVCASRYHSGVFVVVLRSRYSGFSFRTEGWQPRRYLRKFLDNDLTRGSN